MQNLYVINEQTKVDNYGPSYIEAGIHENIKLVEVKYDQTPKGNEFLAFTWANEYGDKVTLTEWPYKPRSGRPYDQQSPDEKKLTEGVISNQVERVTRILMAYLGEIDKEVVNSSSFKEFAEKVVTTLKDSVDNETKLVRVKVVYDKNGYTIVSNRSAYPFIEPMSVAKDASKIRILAGDLMERPKVDKEDKEENPLGETPTDKNVDDIPF